MDFTLNEEQQAYRDAAQAFANKELAPNAAQWDGEAIFPVDIIYSFDHIRTSFFFIVWSNRIFQI